MLKTKDKEKVRKFIKTIEKVLWEEYGIRPGGVDG